MKKGYWVVIYRSISDQSVLTEYGKLATVAIKDHGGRTLIRTSDIAEVHEAGIRQRVTITEFESLGKALGAYHSDGYQTALRTLGSAAERDFRIVEGVD